MPDEINPAPHLPAEFADVFEGDDDGSDVDREINEPMTAEELEAEQILDSLDHGI